MRNKQRESVKSVQRRLEIEQSLSHYPALPPDKVLDLVYWFKREATAMEIASVASNPAIQTRYRQFREKHITKLSAGETILATGLGTIIIVVMAVLISIP